MVLEPELYLIVQGIVISITLMELQIQIISLLGEENKHHLNINEYEKLSFIFLKSFFVGCGSVKNFTTFSKRIYKVQKGKKECGVYPKLSFESRKKLFDQIDFIEYSNDTVYSLESYYLETCEYYNAIWTKDGIVEYKVYQNELEYGESFFVSRLYRMIEEWDLPAIRKAEKKSKEMLGGAMMTGARIIVDEGKFKMDCVQFNEFFNIGLDN